MDDKVMAIVVTGIVGLLPLIANPIISAVQGRGRRSRRDDAISVAKERIEFVESWIKAQESVSSAAHLAELKKAASQELDEIRTGVLSALDDATHKPASTTGKHLVERLLLLYRPDSIGGWLWHTLFYVTGLMLIAAVAITLISLPGSSPSEIASNLYFMWTVGGLMLVLALIFRGLAAVTDRRLQARLRAGADGK